MIMNDGCGSNEYLTAPPSYAFQIGLSGSFVQAARHLSRLSIGSTQQLIRDSAEVRSTLRPALLA